jgi:hypothetical protein
MGRNRVGKEGGAQQGRIGGEAVVDLGHPREAVAQGHSASPDVADSLVMALAPGGLRFTASADDWAP